MKKSVLVLALCFIMAAQGTSFAGSTVDSLVQKLVEKGILSDKEATQLKGEIASNESAATEAVAKKQVPDWVQNMKVGGDMRVRLQTEHRTVATGASQDAKERVRGRMRARLNFETKVNDKAKVVIGIATDGGTSGSPNNPRSNNVTFSGNNAGTPFSKPNVILNKAYGQYTFNENWTLTGGKMDNPFWEPMEFLWDSDITPEGGSVRFDKKLNSMVSVFATGSLFLLNEFSGSASDPFMYVGQFGAMINPMEKLDAKATFSYTGYANIKNGFTGGTGTGDTNNTRNAAIGSTGLKYDYRNPMGSVDIGINDPFGEMLPFYIPRIGVFGEYTANIGATKNNTAWMTGVYVGNSKLSGWGTWKLTGAYKSLGRDAWLDILPDSDFYGGATGAKGIESMLEIGLAKNLSFNIDYYHAAPIHATQATGKAPEHVVQYDILWKF